MMTPTHLISAGALFAKPGSRTENSALFAGAFFPDLSIFVLFFWAKAVGIPDEELWSTTYWSEPWQTFSAISNSVPLFAVLAVAAWALGWRVLLLFALGALVHLALDFPFHATDAHRHFWPITDWRFYSPFSYWDGRYGAEIVRVIELAIMGVGLAFLWRRFDAAWVKVAVILGLLSTVAVPTYFMLTLG